MLLRAIDVRKSFGGVQALKGVSLDLYAGEVHALVGENGAGKSTLIKIFTGALQPDEGEIWLRGELVEHNSPRKARELGIAVIYQQPSLFPELSVAENIAFAKEGSNLGRRVDWKRRRTEAASLLSQLGSAISPDALVSTLSMPEQQIVEIAKALDANPSLLIMDEPTASLGKADAENLLRIVRELRDRGTGILYISHRLEELFQIGNRVTVLRDGNSVGTQDISGTTADALIRMMVGRDLQALYPKHDPSFGDTALEVRDLSCKELKLNNISFAVRRGEILGFAGLVGSGRTQLAEALFGLWRIDSGTILVDGRTVPLDSPADAVRAGLAYVPEDRCRHGVILDMTIAANTTLASLDQVSTSGMLRAAAENDAAEKLKDRLQVRTTSVNTAARNLSGGNQQKVALARWLLTKPRILILDEPTQGIDVGAKSEIYRLIDEFAHSGLAIVLISSDMSELLAMSDRIAVMSNGTVAGILPGRHATPDQILTLAVGHTPVVSERGA